MSVYDSCIIGDPNGKSWDFVKEVYNKLNEKGCYELIKLNVKEFKDGEIKTKIEKNVRRKHCFFIHDSRKDPSRWLTELLLVNDSLKNSSAQEIVNVLPYLRYARQDRKDESRVPITSKVVADSISKYAHRVLTTEVHNPSIQGFFEIPFDSLHSFPTVEKHIEENHPELLKDLVVVSPDVGGGLRAEALANRIGAEGVAIGYKSREKAGEVKDQKITGELNGKNVIVVDDITDSGGTLCKTCETAKEMGANKVAAYITHGLFSEGVDKISKYFDLLMVGDTVVDPKIAEHEKVEVVSFAEIFAEAIHRLNEGKSLSELFE